MKTILVVTRDFAEFKRGAEIEDAKLIDKILASPNAVNVVKVESKPSSAKKRVH